MKVSEIPAKPSTTKEDENNTQSGSSTLPDINFSINLNVNVNIDPEIKALLTKIFDRIEAHKQAVSAQSESIDKPIIKLEDLQDDEPTEISHCIPEKMDPENYGQIVYGEEGSWNRVYKYKNLRWKIEGKNLIIRYWSGNVTTSWENMERLAKLPEKQRNEEINSLSNSCNYKTAMRMFSKCLTDGTIKRPANPDAELEENFAKFVEEEDNSIPVEGIL